MLVGLAGIDHANVPNIRNINHKNLKYVIMDDMYIPFMKMK